MKKYFIFAAIAAAGLFASCSSSDDAISSPVVVDNDNDRVPIQLGIGAAATADVTRGMGTVGDLSTGSNIWKGQKVNIFMFKKGTLKLSRTLDPDGIAGYPTPIYNNTVMTTPSETANTDEGVAQEVLDDGRIKLRYYPIEQHLLASDAAGYANEPDNRKADFWGYFIDDAGTGENGVGVPVGADVDDATQVTVPFTIDGSQDLMVAKTTALTAAQSDKLTGDNADNYYSAYSARRDIQPNLSFAHQLTRLTFEFVGGTKATIGWNWDPTANAGAGAWVNSKTDGNKFTGVFVKSVKVVSNTTGNLIAAYTGNTEPKGGLISNWGTEAQLSLKSGDIDVSTDAVDAVLYTEATKNEHNSALPNAISAGAFDADQAKAANEHLQGAVSAGTVVTDANLAALNAVLDPDVAVNDVLTADQAAAYNATLTGHISAGDVSAADAIAFNDHLPGAVAIGDVKTPAQEAHVGTGKLKDLYTPAADFPDINPSNYSDNVPGMRAAWNTWGDALTVASANWSKVYALTGTVTTPATEASEFTADEVPVGGALLVEPRASYTVVAELGQYLKDKDDDDDDPGDEYYVRYMPVQFTISAGENASFLKGNSYNVKVKVYGSEQIIVTTTLQAWTAGTEQVIDTENQGF